MFERSSAGDRKLRRLTQEIKDKVCECRTAIAEMKHRNDSAAGLFPKGDDDNSGDVFDISGCSATMDMGLNTVVLLIDGWMTDCRDLCKLISTYLVSKSKISCSSPSMPTL